MARREWFEISDEGWRRLSGGRPLARLLLEALQNAFDQRAQVVSVELYDDRVVVEDDAEGGFSDPRLVYTVFLSDKTQDASRRGRMGRGLKELVAAMDRAVVETVGTTVTFDAQGRHEASNERKRGTRLVVERQIAKEERAEAEAWMRQCIPPKGTSLRVNGRTMRRPRLVLTLPSCELDTVVVRDGLERVVSRSASVSLYAPRRGETPMVLEMGIAVQPWSAPWHVDVGQRIPMTEGRDAVSERYLLALKATLLEAMIHRYLDTKDLRADWVHDVIGRHPLRPAVLDAYVSKVFPRGSVLSGTSRGNDRAKQLGAHVVDARAISQGEYGALARVLETSDEYVRRRAAEFAGEDVEPDETQQRFAESVRWLARRIAGRVVRVRFFARDPNDEGLIEDATTDTLARVISFNVRGPLHFDDVLDPQTLGVVLHEIAHLETPEHDLRFVDRLQFLAGAMAKLAVEWGPGFGDALRSGDPDRRKSS